jgi:hypothetical protein
MPVRLLELMVPQHLYSLLLLEVGTIHFFHIVAKGDILR